jgi:hypothetical protein
MLPAASIRVTALSKAADVLQVLWEDVVKAAASTAKHPGPAISRQQDVLGTKAHVVGVRLGLLRGSEMMITKKKKKRWRKGGTRKKCIKSNRKWIV